MRRFMVVTACIASLLVIEAGARAEESNGSPDADFFGFWRVIEAETAPWVPARPLRAGEAPLVGWTVEFADDALKGPAPLGCAPARYSGRQTALSDVFNRRLDRDNYIDQGSQLGFMGGAETEHVACGPTQIDYYLTHGGDLVTASGDVIYRLRKPKGDPRDFKAGDTAPGFDCITADNAARKIICLDLKLSALDRKMMERYRGLEAEETPASFATVRAAQDSWFSSIVRRCSAGGDLPAHADDVAQIRDCLADLYPERADLLDGATMARAGSLVLEPRMRFVLRTKPLFTNTDCYPWMVGGAAADAFNASVGAMLEADAQRIDERGLFVPANFPVNLALSARRTYAVVRFDTRVVSLQVRTEDYTGGSHEQVNEFSINWDVVKRRPIGFADLFALDKDGLQFATNVAMKDLARQFGSDGPPRQDDVAQVVSDPRDWLFSEDAAIVHFPVYSVANYSQGAFDVAIPFAALKDYLMPNAAVLARQ
jgi:hypothetical protein